jgi:hypothetical protein
MSIPQTQMKGSITLASDAGASTTIGNSTGVLTIISPLTPSYTTASTVNQVGYIAPIITNATDPLLKSDPFTIPSSFANYSLVKVDLTAGTWIITAVLSANQNTNFGYVINAITPVRDSINFTNDYYVQSANTATFGLGYLATRTVYVSAPTSYYLTTRTNVGGQVVSSYKLQAVRIA